MPVIPRWLVWLVALGFALAGLSAFGILNNNEGLYSEISREMLAAHDWQAWVIPHLNGLPYMEKPPLLYWLTALSFAMFGQTEWAARLIPALSSLACAGLLMRFGDVVRRPQAGRFAVLMFVSGVGVTAMSHVLMFDMLLTALLTAALMQAYHYANGGGAGCVRRAYGFLALAVLVKGPVAVALFGCVIFGFTLLSCRSVPEFLRACARWFEPWGIGIFLGITMPWHLAAGFIEPAFARFYFINEQVLRFVGKREPHDYYTGAWWYYLPRMAIYLFPWSFLLPCLLQRRQCTARPHQAMLRRFLWMAWLAPLIFFSASSAKANYYLVAAMPFAAFHLAIAIEDRGFSFGLARALPGLLIGVVAGMLGIAFTIQSGEPPHSLIIWGLRQSQFVFVFIGGLSLLALGCAIVAWRRVDIGVLAYLLLSVWIWIGLMPVLKALEPSVSTREIAQFVQSRLPDRTVYLFRNFEEKSSLPFYLKHIVPVIDTHSNDLFWGNKLQPNDILITRDRFSRAMRTQPVAVVVMDRQFKDFKMAGFLEQFKEKKHIGDATVFFN